MSGAPKKMGMSLYANLLGEKAQGEEGATISGAPVKYDTTGSNAGEAGEAQKKKDAALKFQPVRRPQAQPKINRPKPPSSSSAHQFSSSIATTATADSPEKQLPTSSTPAQQPNVQRSKLEDWVGDEDDGHYYQDNRPKGGRRNKKKKGKGHETRVWDWDDIYDPTLPNNYADYKGSEEQYREIRDWKARLYYHQLKEAKKASKNGPAFSDEGERETVAKPANGMFAPPANLNFAPPSFDDAPARPAQVDNDDDYYPPSVSSHAMDTSDAYEPPVSFAPASAASDTTGDDPYMRRSQMSAAPEGQRPMPPPPFMPATSSPASAPSAGVTDTPADVAAKRAEAQAKIAAFKAKLAADQAAKAGNGAAASPTPPAAPSAQPVTAVPTEMPPPPQEPGVTVSKGPVRYQDADVAMHDAPQSTSSQAGSSNSKAPGQKGFAERLLKKYGWEKGQGLGASGEGITTAIVAKAEKRKKRSDAEGGGWVAPVNMGKIVGGKKRKTENDGEDEGAQVAMSEVVKLVGMCKGMDLDHEIQENGLYDEIGKEMEGEYGKVERLVIWREEAGGSNDVFVKFTSQLSAMRCVQGMNGVEFAGNEVVAGFFDARRFEVGEYA